MIHSKEWLKGQQNKSNDIPDRISNERENKGNDILKR